jgi:hypothetical protein
MQASVDMLRRVGASEVQIRYQDDEHPNVWMAVAGIKMGDKTVYETDAALSPTKAIVRLIERLIDGGICRHCARPTGITTEIDVMPLGRAICWYQYDPELKTFRRGCEGDTE